MIHTLSNKTSGIIKMQKFTLHTHNNELNFDGLVSAENMIIEAERKGFETIGVSNHIVIHPNMTMWLNNEPMFFDNFNKAIDIYKKHIEILHKLKNKFKIDIKIGFEADFFCNSVWRNNFEKMIKNLEIDYLIGSNHFLKNKDESFICNIYHLQRLNPQPSPEILDEWIINHFDNIVNCIKSGYYTFLAHLDYCSIFNLGTETKFDEYKYKIIDTLKEYKFPFEINTSGYRRINNPHPAPWIIQELAKDNTVPVLISDDAHCPEHIGYKFNETEKLLKDLNYTNRFMLDMLKPKI